MFPPFLWEKIAVFPPKNGRREEIIPRRARKGIFFFLFCRRKRKEKEIRHKKSSFVIRPPLWDERKIQTEMCAGVHTLTLPPPHTSSAIHENNKKKIPLRPPYRAKNRVIRSFSQKSKKKLALRTVSLKIFQFWEQREI